MPMERIIVKPLRIDYIIFMISINFEQIKKVYQSKYSMLLFENVEMVITYVGDLNGLDNFPERTLLWECRKCIDLCFK